MFFSDFFTLFIGSRLKTRSAYGTDGQTGGLAKHVMRPIGRPHNNKNVYDAVIIAKPPRTAHPFHLMNSISCKTALNF